MTVPTLLGVSITIFVLFNLIGGDPAYQILGRHADPARLASLRQEYGLDQPQYIQFFEFIQQALSFNFGRSYATHQKVSDMILSGVGPSLTLTLPALFLTTVLAIWIGLFAAYFRGRIIDFLIAFLCIVGISVPILAYILGGQYFLAYRLGWFPISGFETAWPDRLDYIALPLILFVVVTLGYDTRFYRAVFLDELQKNYIITARAKGLSEWRVFSKHLLANGMVPIITNVVTEIPLLILGAFLLESFFGIPGLGGVTVDAIHNSDFPVIRAMTLLQSVLYIVGNFATDICYGLVDPRVRVS